MREGLGKARGALAYSEAMIKRIAADPQTDEDDKVAVRDALRRIELARQGLDGGKP